MTTQTSQNERVLDALRLGPITQWQAMDAGVMRLGARVFDLRQQGYAIDTELISVPSRYGAGMARVAQYTLIKEADAA